MREVTKSVVMSWWQGSMLFFICDKVVLYILVKYLRCSIDLLILDRSVAMSLYAIFDTVDYDDTPRLAMRLYVYCDQHPERRVFCLELSTCSCIAALRQPRLKCMWKLQSQSHPQIVINRWPVWETHASNNSIAPSSPISPMCNTPAHTQPQR